MLAFWNAGLWLLQLVLALTDTFLTPDLRESGPMGSTYPLTFWVAATHPAAGSQDRAGTRQSGLGIDHHLRSPDICTHPQVACPDRAIGAALTVDRHGRACSVFISRGVRTLSGCGVGVDVGADDCGITTFGHAGVVQ